MNIKCRFSEDFRSISQKILQFIAKKPRKVQLSQIMIFHKNAQHKTLLLPQFSRYRHLLWTQGR